MSTQDSYMIQINSQYAIKESHLPMYISHLMNAMDSQNQLSKVKLNHIFI
jgi:hypothetical protein